MNARFEELVVFVDDVRAIARFYETSFGFSRRRAGEEFVVLEVGSIRLSFQSHKLGIRHGGEKVAHLSMDRAPPPFELAFDCADVDGTYARAVEAGGEPLEDPHDTEWGDRIAHLRDPNGILIGLSRMKKS